MWFYGNITCCLQQDCQMYRAIPPNPRAPVGSRSAVQEPLEQHICLALAHRHIRTQEPNTTSLRPSLTAGPGLLCRTERAPCAKANLPRVIHTQPSRLDLFQLFPVPKGPLWPWCSMGLRTGPALPHRTELQRATQATSAPGLFPVESRGRRSHWVPAGRVQKGSPCAQPVLPTLPKELGTPLAPPETKAENHRIIWVGKDL